MRAAGLPPITTSSGLGRCGSMKMSSVPPLGQVVATVNSPGVRVSSASTSGRMRTSRGMPSLIAHKRLAAHQRLRAAAADPAVQRAVRGDHRLVAGVRGRRRLRAHHGCERARTPRGGVLGEQSQDRVVYSVTPCAAQRRPHLVGGDRHVDVGDAEMRQRVDDRVDERGGRADGRQLADALGADRVVRRRRHGLARARTAGSPTRWECR